MNRILLLIATLFIVAGPASANTLVRPGPQAKIARSSLAAQPDTEWNRLRERGGRNVEIWTLDGDQLNKVMFFGGIASGKPIVSEMDKKHAPLPKVSATMLPTDIPALLESTYRAQFQVNRMTVDRQEAAQLGGRKAIRFSYSFVRQDDEVERRGEAIGAMVDGRLYMVLFEAPSLYFFDRDLDKFRRLAATVTL